VNPVTGTGSCVVNIPEELFDLDGPGHYFRRIKSVSVTIPCVTGPYAGVTCTLAFGSMMVFPATSVLTQGTHY
jgi:Tc toxin complex TcA C-terminal TcB-binding domain